MSRNPSHGQPFYVFVPVSPDRASDDATDDELRRENNELRDMVASLQTALGHKQLRDVESVSRLENVRKEVRNTWATQGLSKRDKQSLCVLHGLAERSALRDPEIKVVDFLEQRLHKIRSGSDDPLWIEQEATRLGLPVRDSAELPIEITCHFGYVNAVEDGIARVSIMDDDEAGVRYTIEAPVNWIPEAYRDDTARVAWVERRYPSGVKGRFEPASGGPVE